MSVLIRPKILSISRRELPAYERADSYTYGLNGTGPCVVSFFDTKTHWSNLDGVAVSVPDTVCRGAGIAKTHLVGAIDRDGRAQFLDVIVSNGRSYRTKSVAERLEALQKILVFVRDFFGASLVEPDRIQRGYLPAFDNLEQSGGAGLFLLRPGKRSAVFCGTQRKDMEE